MTENELKLMRRIADALYNSAYANTDVLELHTISKSDLRSTLLQEYNEMMYDTDFNEHLSECELDYVLTYACKTFVSNM